MATNPDTPDTPGNPRLPNSAEGDAFLNIVNGIHISDPSKSPGASEPANDEQAKADSYIAQTLADYRAALDREYNAQKEIDTSDLREHTTHFFKDHVPTAAAQIVWLAANGTSESVRFNASKAVIAYAYEEERLEGNELKKLFQSLGVPTGSDLLG